MIGHRDTSPADDHPAAEYAAALTEQNRLFADLVEGADPDLPVPTCPGWSLNQLLRHVGRGHRWAAAMVADRATVGLDPRAVPDGRPPDDPAGCLAWLRRSPQLLLDAVAADPDAEVWTFLGPRPARWWVRRRLHEETVHRADAALTLGAPWPIAPTLAADGVDEWLAQLVAGRGSNPAEDAGRPLPDGVGLVLRADDVDPRSPGRWALRGTADGLERGDPTDATDVTVTGHAADLLLALVRRIAADDPRIVVHGDRDRWTHWLAATPY